MCTHIPHAHSHTHAQCIQTCAQCIHTCTLELHSCKVLVPRPYGARHPLLQPNRTKGKHTHTHTTMNLEKLVSLSTTKLQFWRNNLSQTALKNMPDSTSSTDSKLHTSVSARVCTELDWGLAISGLQLLTNQSLQLHCVSSKATNTFWELLHSHLVLIEKPAERLLIQGDLLNVQTLGCWGEEIAPWGDWHMIGARRGRAHHTMKSTYQHPLTVSVRSSHLSSWASPEVNT